MIPRWSPPILDVVGLRAKEKHHVTGAPRPMLLSVKLVLLFFVLLFRRWLYGLGDFDTRLSTTRISILRRYRTIYKILLNYRYFFNGNGQFFNTYYCRYIYILKLVCTLHACCSLARKTTYATRCVFPIVWTRGIGKFYETCWIKKVRKNKYFLSFLLIICTFHTVTKVDIILY